MKKRRILSAFLFIIVVLILVEGALLIFSKNFVNPLAGFSVSVQNAGSLGQGQQCYDNTGYSPYLLKGLPTCGQCLYCQRTHNNPDLSCDIVKWNGYDLCQGTCQPFGLGQGGPASQDSGGNCTFYKYNKACYRANCITYGLYCQVISQNLYQYSDVNLEFVRPTKLIIGKDAQWVCDYTPDSLYGIILYGSVTSPANLRYEITAGSCIKTPGSNIVAGKTESDFLKEKNPGTPISKVVFKICNLDSPAFSQTNNGWISNTQVIPDKNCWINISEPPDITCGFDSLSDVICPDDVRFEGCARLNKAVYTFIPDGNPCDNDNQCYHGSDYNVTDSKGNSITDRPSPSYCDYSSTSPNQKVCTPRCPNLKPGELGWKDVDLPGTKLNPKGASPDVLASIYFKQFILDKGMAGNQVIIFYNGCHPYDQFILNNLRIFASSHKIKLSKIDISYTNNLNFLNELNKVGTGLGIGKVAVRAKISKILSRSGVGSSTGSITADQSIGMSFYAAKIVTGDKTVLNLGNIVTFVFGDGLTSIISNTGMMIAAGQIANLLEGKPDFESQKNPSDPQGFSLYAVRNQNNFSAEGISYLILPHIILNKPARVTLNYSYHPEILSPGTFKSESDEDIISSCNSTLMTKISKTIGNSGGIISLNSEIILNISQGALDSDINFSITKYNLTACNLEDNYSECTNDSDCHSNNLCIIDSCVNKICGLPKICTEPDNECKMSNCDALDGNCYEENKLDGTSCSDEGGICQNGTCIPVECTPDCTDRVCGDDGCGGSCGEACGEGEECNWQGVCVSKTNCHGADIDKNGAVGVSDLNVILTYFGKKNCSLDNLWCKGGDINKDGAVGGADLTTVLAYYGKAHCCIPDCTDKNCGDDGCGESCGECENETTCVNGNCISNLHILSTQEEITSTGNAGSSSGSSGGGGSSGGSNNSRSASSASTESTPFTKVIENEDQTIQNNLNPLNLITGTQKESFDVMPFLVGLVVAILIIGMVVLFFLNLRKSK